MRSRDPGHRTQDERLDRSVFFAGIAIIGLGMAFLIAMVLVFFPEWISPRALVPEGGTSMLRGGTLYPLSDRDRWWISDLSAPRTRVVERSRSQAPASEDPSAVDQLRQENQAAGASSLSDEETSWNGTGAGWLPRVDAGGAGRDGGLDGPTAESATVIEVLDVMPGENGAAPGGEPPQSAGPGPAVPPGGVRGQSSFVHAADRSGRYDVQQVLSGIIVAIGKGSITLQTENGLLVVKIQGNTVILVDGHVRSLQNLTVGQSVTLTADVGGKSTDAPAATASARASAGSSGNGHPPENGPRGQSGGPPDRALPPMAQVP